MHTSFLAVTSKIASAQENAIAMHRLSSTLDLGLFRAFQKERVTTMVITTAISEI